MSNEPSGFSDQEVEALVALVRAIAEIDNIVSIEESEAMNGIAEWAGEDRFWALFEKSRSEKADVSDLEALAASVVEPESRKTVYGMLRLLSVSDGVAGAESAALERLRECWELPPHAS